jgi:hypothetical protein
MKKLLLILLLAAGLIGCKSADIISEENPFEAVTIIFSEENPEGTAPIKDSQGKLLGFFKRIAVKEYEEMYTEDRAMEVYDTSQELKYFIDTGHVEGDFGFIVKDVNNNTFAYLLLKLDREKPYFEIKLFEETPAYVFSVDKDDNKRLTANDELVYTKQVENKPKKLTMLKYHQLSSFKTSYYKQHPEDALIFAAFFYLLADLTYNKTFIYSM